MIQVRPCDLIAWDGQSLAVYPAGDAYPAVVAATRSGVWGPVVAREGTTWSTRSLTADRRVDRLAGLVTGAKVLADCGGTSELIGGTLADDVFAAASAYWSARTSAGFTVLAATCPPSSAMTAGEEAERVAFNELVRGHGVAVVDLAVVPELVDPAGAGYTDGTHFSVAGAAAAGAAWSAALAALGV